MESLTNKIGNYVKNNADFYLALLGGCALMDLNNTEFGALREPLLLAGGLATLAGGIESPARFIRNFYGMVAPITYFWTQNAEVSPIIDAANKTLTLGCLLGSAYCQKQRQQRDPFHSE